MRMKKIVVATLGLVMALTIGLNHDTNKQYASKYEHTEKYTLYSHGDHF